ncbi:SET domain-containing protein [Auriscalpium vulgare]|uniref:SET domain-containing protein n=1 Tax=Auriscalpium vulgare TaxID=40419 RepID=A0ACB8RE71_9AGAM|nr:SET domain-containing protein [Auriscalpium vulgare]
MPHGFLTPAQAKVSDHVSPAHASPTGIAPHKPPPTVPSPVPFHENPLVSQQTDSDVVHRAYEDNPRTFRLRLEHIPDAIGGSHVVTAGLYTTAEQPPLSQRSWKPYDHTEAGCYEIRETAYAGKGMFSLRGHATGSLIAFERPLIIYPSAHVGIAPEGEAAPLDCSMEEGVIARMPNEMRRRLLALHNSQPAARSPEKSICQTNAFNANRVLGCIGSYGVVFETLSLVNHSCVPNAVYHWAPHALAGEIRAQRPIAPGEEVTLMYTDVFAPYDDRRAVLRRHYAFACTCPACRLPPAARAKDDDSRHVGKQLAGMVLPDVTMDEAVFATKKAQRYARLLRAASLWQPVVWEKLARALAMSACALGDAPRAARWARTAAAATRAAIGVDAGWDAVAAAPEQTEWWLTGQRREQDGASVEEVVIWNGPQFCPNSVVGQ